MNPPVSRPPSAAPRRRRTVRRLAALTAAVLLVHGWLLAVPLSSMPIDPVAQREVPVRALQTRTVVLPAAVAPLPPRPVATRVSSRVRQAVAAPRPSLDPPPGPPTPPVQTPDREPEAAADATATAPAPPSDTASESAAADPVALLSVPTSASPAIPAAGPAVPFVPPPSAQLRYEVQAELRGIRQTLDGSLNWQQDGHSYRLHMAISWGLLGSRVQTSTGHLGPNGLHPLRFSEKTRSERAAHFDEAGQRIRYSANTPDAPLLPGHQDRLSVFFQLAGLAQGRPERFSPGQAIQMPITGSRDSEIWSFQVLESGQIDLPQGPVRAIHLRRLPRKEFDSTVEVWLAPDQGHLPVRMRITQANGDVADQRLLPP